MEFAHKLFKIILMSQIPQYKFVGVLKKTYIYLLNVLFTLI
jgi:hypothetical protein